MGAIGTLKAGNYKTLSLRYAEVRVATDTPLVRRLNCALGSSVEDTFILVITYVNRGAEDPKAV